MRLFRSIAVLVLLFAACSLQAQQFTGSLELTYANKDNQPESLGLYKYIGYNEEQVADLTQNTAGSFQLSGFDGTPGIYFIGATDGTWPVVLVGAETVRVVIGEDDSPSYPDAASSSAQYWGLWQLTDSLNNAIGTRYREEAENLDQAGAEELLTRLFMEWDDAYDQATAGFTGILKTAAGLRNFRSFAAAKRSHPEYTSEAAYVLAEYLARVDYQTPLLLSIPEFYFYLQNLPKRYQNANVEDQAQADNVLATYEKLPSEGPIRAEFLANILIGTTRVDDGPSELFYTLTPIFTKAFPEHMLAEGLGQMYNAQMQTRVGSLAPDIEGETPDGSILKLSSLRGKYVLIDFWASWCGPCRMENPNVVRMYAEYKDKGFEIFGVSLDDDHKAWVDAIKADELTWQHVSDLGGWESKFAGLYGVNAIPMTFLLDREGRIIAKGLRGSSLEEKLAELLP